MSRKNNEKKFVKLIKKEDLMDYTVEERERVLEEITNTSDGREEAMENLVTIEKETIEELFYGEGRPVRAAFNLLVAARKKTEGKEESSIFEPNLKNGLDHVEGIGYVVNKKRSDYRYLISGIKALNDRIKELGDYEDIRLEEAFVIYSAANMLVTSVNGKLEEVKNKQYEKDEVLIPEKDIIRGIKLNRLEEKLKNEEFDGDDSVDRMVNAFKELADDIISTEEKQESDEEKYLDNEPVRELRTDDKILMRIVFGENTDCKDGSHYSNVLSTLVDSVNGGFKKVLNIKDSSMNVIVNNLVRYFKNYSEELDKENEDADKLIVEKYKALLHEVFTDKDLKVLINRTLASYADVDSKAEEYENRISHYECAVVTSVYLAINTYILVRLAKRDADRHIREIEFSRDKAFDDIAFRVSRINNALLTRFNLLTNCEYKNINNTNVEDGLDKALTVSLMQTYLYTVLNRIIRDDEISIEDEVYLATVLMLEFYLDRGAKSNFIIDELKSNLEKTPLSAIKNAIENKANMTVNLVGDLPYVLTSLLSDEYIESLLGENDLAFRRLDDENDIDDPKVLKEFVENFRNNKSNPLTDKDLPVNKRLELVEDKYLLGDGKRDIFYHCILRVTKDYYEKNKQYFISEGAKGTEDLNIIKILETNVLKGITLMKLPIVTKNLLKNEETGEEMVEIGVLIQATALDKFMRAKFFGTNDPVEWSISFMGDRSINYYRALANNVIIDDSKSPYVMNAKIVKFYDDNEKLGSVEFYNGDSPETTGTRLMLHNDAFFLGTEEEFEKDYNTFIEPIPNEIIQKMIEDSQDIKNSTNNVDITDDLIDKDIAELLEALKAKGITSDDVKPLDFDKDNDDDENGGGKVN